MAFSTLFSQTLKYPFTLIKSIVLKEEKNSGTDSLNVTEPTISEGHVEISVLSKPNHSNAQNTVIAELPSLSENPTIEPHPDPNPIGTTIITEGIVLPLENIVTQTTEEK